MGYCTSLGGVLLRATIQQSPTRYSLLALSVLVTIQAGGAYFCSTQGGNGQSRGPVAATVTRSPYIQARHGPHGKHSTAEHEGV